MRSGRCRECKWRRCRRLIGQAIKCGLRLVPCGRHGVLCCVLSGPHHCSCVASSAVWYLSQITHREGLLTNTLGLAALLIAVVIHTVDVAMSVFGLKLQSHRDTMNVLSLCHLSERSESHA